VLQRRELLFECVRQLREGLRLDVIVNTEELSEGPKSPSEQGGLGLRVCCCTADLYARLFTLPQQVPECPDVPPGKLLSNRMRTG
jgi:hypothetical protein